MNKIRIMRPLKRDISRHEFLSFDIETYNSEKITKKLKTREKYKEYQTQKFLCGSVYVDGEGYIFWNKEAMKDFILQRKYIKYWKIATNLYFDMSFLIEDIYNFEHKSFKFGRYGKHKFVDVLSFSSNFTGVKAQGNIIGLEKLNTPKSWLRKPENYQETEEMSEYCIRDSEISCKFAYWYQECLNSLGGELKVTLAQCSLDLFKRKFLKHNIYGDSEDKIDFTRESYKGGRVETFQRGNKKFNKHECFYYDVNSLYPFIMKSFNLPDPSCSYWIHKNDLNVSYIRDYEGISECLIEVPETMNIPILPIKHDDKLIFPVGTIRGTWTHPEIMHAILFGCRIKKIYRQLIYRFCFSEYKEFISELYSLRSRFKKENNEAEYVVKLLMNSSYGKLGQDNTKYSRMVHVSKIDIENLYEDFELIGDIETGWLNLKNKKNYIPSFVNPIIASYITALARIHMHKLYMKYENELIYSDTDSLIIEKKLDDNLISSEIGFLKIEYKIKELTVVRSKMYSFIDYSDSEHVKAKGFHSLKDIKDFHALIDGTAWSVHKMSKFRESIRNDVPFNSVVEETKMLDTEDTKRIWKEKFIKNGFQHSKPIKVQME